MKQIKKVVTLGGGTGQFTLLSGLKNIPDISITAIVSMADSGGSSGRLRDELGVLPPGDVLKALLALSELPEDVIRELLLHRFHKGVLAGHTAGNMLLTILSSYSGSFVEAVRAFEEMLHVKGRVLPATVGNITLHAELEDGTRVVGETNIDIPKHDASLCIKRVWLDPNEIALSSALQAIREADTIVLGPGDVFTSLLPVLLVKGLKETLQKVSAPKIYVCNVMTKLGETHGFKASDFVHHLEKYMESKLDAVLCNTARPSSDVVEKYKKENAEFVEVDILNTWEGRKIVQTDLLSSSGQFARHDSNKLSRAFADLLQTL